MCIKTNVNGAQNVVASRNRNMVCLVLLLYQQTKPVRQLIYMELLKLTSDKLFVAANHNKGGDSQVKVF